MKSSLIFQWTMCLSVATHGGAAVWMTTRTTPPSVAAQTGKTSIRLSARSPITAPSQPKPPRLTPVETPAAEARRLTPQAAVVPPAMDGIAAAPRRVDRIEPLPIPLPQRTTWTSDILTATAAQLPKDTAVPELPAAAEVWAKADAGPESVASRGAVDSLPSPLATNPTPIYPLAARQDGVEGEVTLRITVGADGRVIALTVHRSSGSPLLDESAATTVRDWKFTPAHRRGAPVDFQVLLPIVFKIAGQS